MKVLVQENPANNTMKNQPYVAGELSAPAPHPTPILYSHYQATKDYNALNQDIYTKTKHSKSADTPKTPKSVFAFLGAIGLVALYEVVKHVILKK